MIYICHIAFSCGGYNPEIIRIIQTTLSFFMSWFFFKGGMMHKVDSTKLILQKSGKRLLVPFLLFLLLGLLLDGGAQYLDGSTGFCFNYFFQVEIKTFFTHLILWPTAVAWFLLSLCVARIVFNILHQRVHPLLITIAFACLAYSIYVINGHGWELRFYIIRLNYDLGFPSPYMGNMCHGLSVYSLGYYLKDRQFNNSVFVVALFLFVLKFIIPAGIDFRANESNGSGFILSVLYGMSGCIVINNIFKRFCNKRLPLVTYIGCNSMVYYLVHYPVIYATITFFWAPFVEKELWYRFLVLSIIVTVFLIIAEYIFRIKKLRFIIGG